LCQAVKDWPIPGKQNLKRVPVSLQAIRNQFAVIQMHFHFAISVSVVILQRSEHFWFPHFHISVIFQKGAPGKGVAATGCLLRCLILEQCWRLHANLSQYKFDLWTLDPFDTCVFAPVSRYDRLVLSGARADVLSDLFKFTAVACLHYIVERPERNSTKPPRKFLGPGFAVSPE